MAIETLGDQRPKQFRVLELDFVDVQSSEIIEIWQGQIGITHSEDPKPLITSAGASSCTPLVGYSEFASFVLHPDYETDVLGTLERYLTNLPSLVNAPETGKFSLYLNGNASKRNSILIQSIKSMPARIAGYELQLVAEDVLNVPTRRALDIGIDSRTGKPFYYPLPLVGVDRRTSGLHPSQYNSRIAVLVHPL
ncbi:MAG: hypothetical protein HY361_04705 [Candidatus Aenigmarchaeota archaeon]|nr:hypothetical protein [Candidatus Aenigmarchaeota archaeon]